jgi:putative ABC transport system permease protein
VESRHIRVVIARLRYRFRALFRRGALESEMLDEMRLHLERRIAVLVERGMTPAAARLAARKEFGNVSVHQEEGRDARGTQWLDTLLGDLRFALRHFGRRRLATATIVAVLSLGIAVHAFELTLLRVATVKPPPGISSSVPLARVRGLYRAANQPEWSGRWMPYPEVRQLAALDGVFSSLAVSSFARVVVARGIGRRDDIDEQVVTVQFVNDDYFRTLGVDVLRGQGLPRSGSGATGGELVGVVSDATWDRVLGRPDTVGQTLVVNGRLVRVAGVAPPRFTSSIGSDNPGLTMWMPLESRPLILAASGATAFALASPDSGLFEVVGRLRDGINADSATRMVRLASAGIRAAITQPTSLDTPRILYDIDAVNLRGVTEVGSDLPLITGIWAIVSTLILLVVCTNVSGLIAASAATRGHEIAVRLSLGASRRRIVRQLLTESCILSLAGSAAGVLIYWSAFRLARAIPEAQYYAPDLGTLSLALVSALGVGILFGLTPALHAARGDVRGALSASGPGVTGPSRLQRTLVTAQITLTQPLLVAIASFVAILLMMSPKELPESVQEQVVKFSIDQGSLAGGPEERVAALQRMFTHILETPGVVSVLPDASKSGEMKFSVVEQERVAGPVTGKRGGKQVTAALWVTRPGFFKLLDVPLLGGDDRIIADSMRTLVIGTDLARSLLGDVNPVGRYLEATAPGVERRRYLVTGVYDSRLIGETDQPVVYRPVRSWWPSKYLVRTSRPASDLMIPVRRAIRAELPTIPIDSWTTLADYSARQGKQARMGVLVITGTVTLVLLISCIGLYGVVSLAVLQRQREIGIRMALGARAREVVSLFYRSGMKLTVMGLVFGLPISLAGAYILLSMENLNLQGRPSVLLVGAGVGAVMLIVASLATVFPATRAATVDPVSVLRSE